MISGAMMTGAGTMTSPCGAKVKNAPLGEAGRVGPVRYDAHTTQHTSLL